MKKYTWLVFCFSIFALSGCDPVDARGDDPEVDKSIQELESYDNNCQDEFLTFSIDRYEFKVRREGLSLYIQDDGLVSDWGKRCDVSRVGGVIGAGGIGGLNLGVEKLDPEKVLRHTDNNNNQIEKFKNTKKVLSSGVVRYQTKNAQIYVLPKYEKSTAASGAIIRCTGSEEKREIIKSDFCQAVYEYPEGVMLKYRFFRSKYSEDEFIEVDESFRDKLESLIVR